MRGPNPEDLRAKVFEDRITPGDWRVEKMDDDGGFEVVKVFTGPDAREQAIRYAEREFGVFRSWELTKGNFWRIFAVLFVSWVPAYVVVSALFWAVLGFSVIPGAIAEAHKHAPHDPALFQAVFNVIWNGLKHTWPYLVAIMVLPLPVFYGLLFGPAAFAYRALMPGQSGETGAPTQA